MVWGDDSEKAGGRAGHPVMAPSGIAASPAASSGLASRTIGQHKHGHAPSISDVGAAGANAASAKSRSGKIGGLLDVKV